MYIVNVKFSKDSVKTYLFNDYKNAKEVAEHAMKWSLDVEVLKEHKGYQEVIYFLD